MKKFLMAAGAAALAMTAQVASAATFNFSFAKSPSNTEGTALSGMGVFTTDDTAITIDGVPGTTFFAITGLTGTVSYSSNAPVALSLAEVQLPNGDALSSFLQLQNNVFSIFSLVTTFLGGTNTTVAGIFDGSRAEVAQLITTNPNRVGEGELINNVTFSISAVPEPATWGLMLVGFGMVGASVRRRRVTFANA